MTLVTKMKSCCLKQRERERDMNCRTQPERQLLFHCTLLHITSVCCLCSSSEFSVFSYFAQCGHALAVSLSHLESHFLVLLCLWPSRECSTPLIRLHNVYLPIIIINWANSPQVSNCLPRRLQTTPCLWSKSQFGIDRLERAQPLSILSSCVGVPTSIFLSTSYWIALNNIDVFLSWMWLTCLVFFSFLSPLST